MLAGKEAFPGQSLFALGPFVFDYRVTNQARCEG